MEKLSPSFVSCMKSYSKKQFGQDVISGIIVAIIALPLSIALAIASGVGPAVGLYTAILAGFIVSLLGGSKVQIAGPTAAFATIVAGIVATKGISGLAVATIMAGIILIIMGLLKLGNLIKFIPRTITTGFTSGIAVTILIGQLKDFFGLTFQHAPIETMEKLTEVIRCFGTFNVWAFAIGILALAILIFLPRLLPKVPASLVAVIVCAIVVKVFDLDVNTIGVLYPDISSAPPSFAIPDGMFNLDNLISLLPDAVTIAVLAGVESLLSCVVADGMIGAKHNSNMELVAQGLGNIGSALFGGIPATGAIARTAANIKNGGRTPVAGMVHAIVLLAVLVVFMPYAKLIPMPAIAAILFVVAYNMSEWREFTDIIKKSPKSDTLVLVLTFILTVVFDLVIAIVVGIILATILFMKRMADESGAKKNESINEAAVYDITGPIFFGASDKISAITVSDSDKALILNLDGVIAIDATGIHALETLAESCMKKDIPISCCGVRTQPMKVLQKAKLTDSIKLYSDINEALKTIK
ncbi:MAG: STAS domain-containing protein [Clostridia bacterium]|nr:STAS domain-containing protein [Clostridia bacterium]